MEIRKEGIELADLALLLENSLSENFCGDPGTLKEVVANNFEKIENISTQEVECVLSDELFWKLLKPSQYADFLSVLKIWGKTKLERTKLFSALKNKNFVDESGKNLLLEKLGEIFEYSSSPEKFADEYVHAGYLEQLNIDEYKKALFKRGNRLIEESGEIKNNEEALEIIFDEKFKKDVLLFGSFFRGFVKFFKQDYKNVERFLRDTEVENVRGGNLIKSPFEMEDILNYYYPQTIGIDTFKMVSGNLDKIYSEKFKKYKEVLLLSFSKSLNNVSVNIVKFKYKNALIGIRKIQKIHEKKYKSSVFYVESPYRNDFLFGEFFDSAVDKLVPNGSIFEATMAKISSIISHHLAHGRVIIKECTETETNKNGEFIESELLWKTERKKL